MTIIEQETMQAIQTACRTFTKGKKIDWEQRRYEIAREVIGHCQKKTPDEMANCAVQVADALIAILKRNEEK